MTTANEIKDARRCGSSGCSCVRGTKVHCPVPSHIDNTPSLSVTEGDGKPLWICRAGCPQDEVTAALVDLGLYGSKVTNGIVREKVKPIPGLTVEAYAKAKGISMGLLKEWNVYDDVVNGVRVVVMPYPGTDGAPTKSVRHRLAIDGPDKFRWENGSKPILYGLQKLQEIREYGWDLFVEGESDTHTGWDNGVPTLGIPGKGIWNPEWATTQDGIDPYAWIEPGAIQMAENIAGSLPNLLIIPAPDGVKDINAARTLGMDVAGLIERLKPKALTIDQFKAEYDAQLMAKIKPVLDSRDPLELVKAEIRRSYGGDINKPLLVYIAMTSRLLKMRDGTMVVHTILLGPSSVGKNYIISRATRLMPEIKTHEGIYEGAFFSIPAGTPRAIIYHDGLTAHRAVVFGEADSIPGLGSDGPGAKLDASEDNPVASAFRNMLQDNELAYWVVVQQKNGEPPKTIIIRKPGPTVLITTAVRRLGQQLMTRLFALDVPEADETVNQALETITALHLHPDLIDGSNEPLIAYQEYLQRKAPWDIVVPFLQAIEQGLPKKKVPTRVLRDYQRTISFIQTIALLRHSNRETGADGRLIADLEDYQTAYELLQSTFVQSVSGITPSITAVVAAVAKLKASNENTQVTGAAIGRETGFHSEKISRAVTTAIANGWLEDLQTKSGNNRNYVLADPLPDDIGLPSPDTVRDLMDGFITPHTDGDPNDTKEWVPDGEVLDEDGNIVDYREIDKPSDESST